MCLNIVNETHFLKMQAQGVSKKEKEKKEVIKIDKNAKKILANAKKKNAEEKIVETAIEKIGNVGDIEVDTPLQAVQTVPVISI